ncbi:hypothetical protein CYMTET_8024, partial [Cymbomonas tetramitiformis]
LSDVDEDINPLLPNRSFGDIEASTFLSRTDIEFSETTDTEIPSPRGSKTRLHLPTLLSDKCEPCGADGIGHDDVGSDVVGSELDVDPDDFKDAEEIEHE